MVDKDSFGGDPFFYQVSCKTCDQCIVLAHSLQNREIVAPCVGRMLLVFND